MCIPSLPLNVENLPFVLWWRSIMLSVTNFKYIFALVVDLDKVWYPRRYLVGLFSLDVNDEIWHDIGLEDGEEGSSVPAWLGNDEVHQGINNVLELD
jgi:hypothetical protein